MLRALFAVLLLVSPSACKNKEGEAGENEATRADDSSGDSKKGAKGPPSVRAGLRTYRALLDESARAELDVGGLLVDFGTADQHKYTRGGWRSGWGRNHAGEGESYADVTSGTAKIEGLARTGAAELVVRARSEVDGQKLATWVDGTMAGEESVGAEWTILRFPVKNASDAGRREVLLRFRRSGSPRAEVDWVYLAAEAGAEPPLVVPRVIPVNLGGRPRRALVAPTSRTYTFYLEPPERASLVFDYGSDKGAKFSVRAQVDGKEPETLFGPKTAASWTEARVDLSDLAGEPVRLELVAEGAEDGITGWGEPEIMVEPQEEEPPASGAAAKNVIFILIDTARADSYGPFGGVPFAQDREIKTPAYDRLAERGTVFLNAYNNENWTKPSVATVLSGLYPTTHDTKTDGAKLPDEVELLPERLKKDGFQTASFIANGYVSRKFGFDQGWDSYKNYIREGIPTEAERVYGDALEWVREQKDGGRFFLYIQTIDPHVVYRVDREYTELYYPEPYKGWLGPTVNAEEQIAISKGEKRASESDLDWVKALYWGEVTYHDEHMGDFIDQMEELGLLEDTLIVVTNDHGEELHEHGRLGHGHSLYEELIRAPLLMSLPGLLPEGARIEEAVEHVDLLPTILDVLGLAPMVAAEGQSLVPLLQGQPSQRPYYAISEFLEGQRSVQVGGWKLIRTPGNRVHLYHLAEDRGENTDYIQEGGREIARRWCEVYLGEGLATPDKSQRQRDITTRRQLEAGEANIDPETRRQLEALGYFGDDHEEKDDGEDKQ